MQHTTNIPNGGIETAVTQQVIDLQHALKMGIKLFCVNCNRGISKKAVVDLSKSAKANGNKFFEPGKLVRGEDALQENTGHKFISLDGKEELTIDSPDIDKSYVIIDGQHRCLACIRFGCNMDFLVMDEASSIGSKIILINTRKSNWNGTDFATYISSTDPKAAETIATIERFAKFDGMAPKVACLFIGINRNTLSRTNLQTGKVDSLTVKQVGNALLIIGALYNKLDQDHRINSLIAQAVYAIRKELDAAEHESFANLMAVAISQMSEETVSSLIKSIDNKNQGEVKSLLQTTYISLRDKDTDASEFEPYINDINEKVKEIMDAEAIVTEPKSLSFSDCDYALRQAQIQGAEKKAIKAEEAHTAAVEKAKKIKERIEEIENKREIALKSSSKSKEKTVKSLDESLKKAEEKSRNMKKRVEDTREEAHKARVDADHIAEQLSEMFNPETTNIYAEN